ncbi:MAG: zinc metalloprotease HtpX, partial [Phormidesmis sp.]
MTTTPPDLERLLNAGIAAYKKGDYAQAKASLTKLSSCASRTYRTRASMGLARVYMAQQDWEKATALCEKLSTSPKSSVRQWALNTLSKIQRRTQPSSAQQCSQLPIQSAKPSASGFQPLSPKPADSAVSIFHYAYLNGEANNATNESSPLASTEQSPIEQSSTEQSSTEQFPVEQIYEWPNAGRLRAGRLLGKMKRSPLWFSQSFGAIAFFGLLLGLIRSATITINSGINLLHKIRPSWIALLPTGYGYWAGRLAIALLIIAIASPWLWDLWLRFTAQKQPFTLQKLRAISPEAAALISKRSQQKRWPFPTLWKLPTEIPLIFSYGWLPCNARLVVSEGLLLQLAADELAALVSYEMAHWKTIYWPLLSLQGLVLQLFHQLYWQLSLWGNELRVNRKTKPLIYLAGAIANLSYVVFWMLRLPGLWLSRVRTYYGDRAAAEATGNPNGLTRALAKLSFSLAESVVAQGYTPAAIESLTLLLPVCTDLTGQSLYGHVPLAKLFAWDSLNPLSSWMSMSDAQPPLGDRLRLIMAYAQHWKLDLEIPLAARSRRHQGLSPSEWARLIGQGMPFFGLAFGLFVGLGLLLLGAIGQWLKWPALDWMHHDWSLVFAAVLMGLGSGTMLRINRFFPDLSFEMPFEGSPSQALSDWISDAGLLPISSVPAKLAGTLIGRPGLANWLGQDLIIKTSEAKLLRLHFFSVLGPLGNVVSLQTKPFMLIGQSVQVLGWFRRGNRSWLDIDKLRLSNGTLLQAAHPICSLGVAITTSGLALWL